MSKVKKRAATGLLAGMITVGMVVGQPESVIIKDYKGYTVKASEKIMAKSRDGKEIEISEEILVLIEKELVFLSEDGYLRDEEDHLIDPETGEIFTLPEEENKKEEDKPDSSDSESTKDDNSVDNSEESGKDPAETPKEEDKDHSQENSGKDEEDSSGETGKDKEDSSSGENGKNEEDSSSGETGKSEEDPSGETGKDEDKNHSSKDPGKEDKDDSSDNSGEEENNTAGKEDGEDSAGSSGKEENNSGENPGKDEDPSDIPKEPDKEESIEKPGKEEESNSEGKLGQEKNSPNSSKEKEDDSLDSKEQDQQDDLNGNLLEATKRLEENIKTQDTEEEQISNAELISRQHIVNLPEIVTDFRFWTVTRKYAFAKRDLLIREEIPEGISGDTYLPDRTENLFKVSVNNIKLKIAQMQFAENVRTVGSLNKDGLMYILKEEEDGWLYVESGSVRGFVKSSEVYMNEDASKILKHYQKEIRKEAKKKNKKYTGIENLVDTALEVIPRRENKAYTYLRATVNQTVVEKDYALAMDGKVIVREEKKEDSREVGSVPEGGLCYILADKTKDWIYIESGNVRGFVKKDSISYGKEVTKYVKKMGEDAFSTGKEKIKPDENAACYYTVTSIKSGVPDGEIRKSIVEFAAQFIGNPYVWGGTSLTNGADCSGFVQSIYKQYGYNLPRVAEDQAQYGTKIPVEDAQPGDLIFYANNGYIYHVVMYAGEGKTIEAMSSDAGIVQAEVSSSSAVWATRILEDSTYGYSSDIGEVNATKDMYGDLLGNFKITYYCACELCCDVETGITATGAPVIEGQTIAVDPKVIPYGTEVIIGGHVFTAEDCGGAIKGDRIDIYVNDHQHALALGVDYSDVYLVK